ncbi:unnamed protein product [Candida verbasci]|uniref:Origin recognition complex subunit 3 n=1 Tax=Candida verbasci TaxID=1227364 RepID=A0A9W4TWY7_9ASCO|nr:unnamed protein product [Candida verbasci]
MDGKTHYWVKRDKKRKQSDFDSVFESLTNQKKLKTNDTPFLNLFNGLETDENVKFRYGMFQRIWSHQLVKIQSILNNANNELFNNLLEFLKTPKSDKLDIGYVQLTSNTANNFRILNEFYNYITDKLDYKIVKLNSKNCVNIKSALREVVKQAGKVQTGKLNYDLDNIKGDERIVVVLEDTNLTNNQVLNQLLKILAAHDLQLKVILGLSCYTVTSWINSNLSDDLNLSTKGYKFKSNDNKSLGYIILNNLFLTPELNDDNPLLIEKKLSTIILSRFENANNSVDSLISEIKLCYMICFYQSPLSILLAKDEFSELYIDGLRKLPSFKKYIEIQLYDKRDVKEIFDSVEELFKSTKLKYKKFKLTIMNAINVIYDIDPKRSKEKFELYKLLINNKLLNSKYLNDCINNLNNYTNEALSVILQNIGKDCKEEIEGVQDEFFIEFNKTLSRRNLSETLQVYFNNDLLTTPLEYMLFNEVFTMNGGTLSSTSLFEENFENLMIKLLRPNLRETVESSLESPETYLGNPLLGDEPVIAPTLSYLYKIYKEAPVSINMYDFFQAYKSVVPRVIRTDDETWHKMVYSWFLQNCAELMHLGLLQMKPKGDYLEKALWKGV